MNRRIRKNSGFTLIEVIISFTIFAIFLTSFLSMMMTLFKISQESNHQYQATVLAQKHIEELKALSGIAEAHNIYEYEGYIIDEEVSAADGYEDRLYKITVKVSRDEQLLETIEGLKIVKE